MALGLVVATDIVNAALTFYVRGKAFAQTIKDKPLLRILKEKQKDFPGGKDNVSSPVQGAYMSDTPGFFQGYSEDDTLSFTQASNLLRATYPWKEQHSGIIITWTELKKDGITVRDHQSTSTHSEVEATRLTGILENRLDDFGESYARAKNLMLWLDGSQDAKQIPGIRSILQDAGSGVANQTIGGLSTTTYPWWNFVTRIGNNALTASAENQTLTRAIRHDIRLLKKYGGKDFVVLCGIDFLDGLELEVQSKGLYTMTGFKGEQEIGMGMIHLKEIGTFMYDPTLDDFGFAKRAYIIERNRLKLRPMQGEEDKLLTPERPYNYFVFLRSMTYTGALEATQLNCHEVVEIK